MQRGHSEVMDEMSMAIPSTAEMSMDEMSVDEMSVAISPAGRGQPRTFRRPAGRPWTATDEMSLSLAYPFSAPGYAHTVIGQCSYAVLS